MHRRIKAIATTGLGLGLLFVSTGLAAAQGDNTLTSSQCAQAGGSVENGLCVLGRIGGLTKQTGGTTPSATGTSPGGALG
jgi:hypothetical protein